MFLRNFVAQLLICVIFEDNKHAVRARSIRGDKVVKTYEKSFEDKKKLLQYVDNLSQFIISVLFLTLASRHLRPFWVRASLGNSALTASKRKV